LSFPFFAGNLSEASRRAASATPPLAPKMMPAPLTFPKNASTGTGLIVNGSMCLSANMAMTSVVVITRSTSGMPSVRNSGRAASYFLALQGMMDTKQRSSASGGAALQNTAS
jgi:hypothetical protein